MLGSVYGVDLQEKNVKLLRNNLSLIAKKHWLRIFGSNESEGDWLIDKIIELNSVQGNSLTYINDEGEDISMVKCSTKPPLKTNANYIFQANKVYLNPEIEDTNETIIKIDFRKGWVYEKRCA